MARVLVADDDPPIRHMIRLACERLAHEVRETGDTESTIGAYLEWKPDLLVLDLVMPGGGGVHVLHAIRFGGERRSAPVLVVSGNVDKSPEELRRSLQVERVLLKPFRINDVVAVVREMLAPGAKPHPA